MAKKGIALPVEYIVVLIIAVIVLLAVISFFLRGSGCDQICLQIEKNKACGVLTGNQCSYPNAYDYPVPNADKINDINQDGTVTVAEICQSNGIPDARQCYIACGCPGPP